MTSSFMSGYLVRDAVSFEPMSSFTVWVIGRVKNPFIFPQGTSLFAVGAAVACCRIACVCVAIVVPPCECLLYIQCSVMAGVSTSHVTVISQRGPELRHITRYCYIDCTTVTEQCGESARARYQSYLLCFPWHYPPKIANQPHFRAYERDMQKIRNEAASKV